MTEISKSGGALLIECLQNLGVTKCFGVPGESYLDVLNALHDTRGKVDFVICRNEGGAAFMAEAWGKLTGKPGICMVTRGPGATNASIGVHTAMQDSTPMILFVGQVGTDMKGREAFQEIEYKSFYGTVAKWVVEIDHVDRVPELVSRAWTTALSGRPGPVVVALPEDMLTTLSQKPACKPVKIPEPAPSEKTVSDALQLLAKTKKPLIIAGGNSWTKEGKAALKAFAETSDIPVVAAFRFQDLIDNESKCYCGDAGVGMIPHIKNLIKSADTILALNIRFGEMTTDAYTLFDAPNTHQTLIHSHLSDAEIGKIYSADLPIHCGPNHLATALSKSPVTGDWAEWRQSARAGFEASLDAPAQPGPVDMMAVTKIITAQLPNDAIITNGAGNFAIWPNKFIKYTKEMRLLAPQSGAMGYGVPASIAAKVADPDRFVLCFAGDGDFQMNCQELGTAMQAGATPIILILNNGTYGTIRMHQERTYPERISGTQLMNPDFVGLAKSYGFYAEKVAATADFEKAFERAIASKTGAVLELMLSEEALTPRQTLSQMRAIAMEKARSF
ncbi:MAG: thiamine pyrophosphate-dependent enzyme [Salaquimonas sp.]